MVSLALSPDRSLVNFRVNFLGVVSRLPIADRRARRPESKTAPFRMGK